jgi:hypothetical protein
LKAGIAVGLAVFVAAGAALADTLKFNANLGPDPQAQTKGNGKGTAALSFDTATKTLTYTITYDGLSAPVAMAAFLSPPPKEGSPPGSLEIKLPAKPASPIQGTMKLTDAQLASLKGGQWLLLIGNAKNPEIGGDIKPAQ